MYGCMGICSLWRPICHHNNNDNILFVQVENGRNSPGCSVPRRGGVDMEPEHWIWTGQLSWQTWIFVSKSVIEFGGRSLSVVVFG